MPVSHGAAVASAWEVVPLASIYPLPAGRTLWETAAVLLDDPFAAPSQTARRASERYGAAGALPDTRSVVRAHKSTDQARVERGGAE